MTRSTKNGISNNYGGMSSPRGGGGVRKGISPYIVIIAMVIQFEVFYFYFGVQNESFINNSGSHIDNNNGLIPTTTAASESISSTSAVVDRERISSLEQKLQQITKTLESHEKQLKGIGSFGGGGNVDHAIKESSSSGSISSTSLLQPASTSESNAVMNPPISTIEDRATLSSSSVSKLMQDAALQLQQQEGSTTSVFLESNDGRQQIVNPYYRFDESKPTCFLWSTNSDLWWVNNPEWYVKSENDTHYCFSIMVKDSLRRNSYRDLHNVQFGGYDIGINTDSNYDADGSFCKNVLSKRMWSSGWGADFANVVDGLIKAVDSKQPFQVTNKPWHYAAGKKEDGSTEPVCSLKTMECYFLPLSKCEARKNETFEDEPFFGHFHPHFDKIPDRYYLQYATRPKLWFRRAVYEFTQKTIETQNFRSSQASPSCSVMHVRRGDVVLHGKFARRYFAIEEYVNALQNATMANPAINSEVTSTIFLITDDANAITEARAKYPNINWIVIDRPRFKGKEGGWENHIPSNDPMLETIVLMAIFRLAETCNVLVHSQSNLSNYIAGIMKSMHRKSFVRINLDESNKRDAYDPSHRDSYKISKSDWSDIS